MLAELGKNAKDVWQDWSTTKRVAIAGCLVVSVVVFAVLLYYLAKPVYSPLYSGLTYQDAGQITAKLKESGVPYQLKNDGSTILVPSDKVYELRIELASLDIPRGGTAGFELFDVSKLGTTDFERQVNYKRALEGELTRTILEIDGVQSVRVHIVIPEKSLFIKDERKPTASVLLGLVPYGEMSPRQINGIVNLIANSVEGLSKDDVTVIDTRGNVLSDMLGNVSGLLSNSQGLMAQMEVEQRYEQELQQRIHSMLEQIYGFGKVVARVKVELDLDHIESIEESFLPVAGKDGIVLREDVLSESYSGIGSNVQNQVGGVGSVDAPTYEWSVTGDGDYEREERTTEYAVNRSERRHTVAPGSVKQLSVVVWIDGELTDSQKTDVENAVASTVGYSQARGDTVHIASAKFSGAEFSTDFQAMSSSSIYYRVYAPVALVLALVIVTILAVYMLIVKRSRHQAETVVSKGFMEMASTAEPVSGVSLKREMSLQEREFEELIRQLKKWTEEKPMEMVQLIRMWANEDR